MKEQYFTTVQVAKILGISRIAVFKRIKSGSLIASRFGRAYLIHKSEFLRFMKKKMKQQRKGRRTSPLRHIDTIS